MRYYGLEPLSNRCCLHCDSLALDIEKGSRGYVCIKHPDTSMEGTLVLEVNDCEDWNCYAAIW